MRVDGEGSRYRENQRSIRGTSGSISRMDEIGIVFYI